MYISMSCSSTHALMRLVSCWGRRGWKQKGLHSSRTASISLLISRWMFVFHLHFEVWSVFVRGGRGLGALSSLVDIRPYISSLQQARVSVLCMSIGGPITF